MRRKIILFFIFFLFLFPFLFFLFQYFSRATSIKANIVIDAKKTLGPVPDRWKALAQGGEEKGVRMLENVISSVAGLYPRYIRLDHIYDFYDVVNRDENGNLTFNFEKLDQTVCDIYNTGAKPFFSLGYMPAALSADGTLISPPKNWNEWALLVQKTIEHYSGVNNRLCGQITGLWKTDIYYEVWNEPDLETFGKWSIYGGKDYKILYFYSALGAKRAKDVYRFHLGGPATTALYKNWVLKFLDFVKENNLRLNFISWHHYSKKADDYRDDIIKLNQWLSSSSYQQYQGLPKIISEWGYDSQPNPIADTEIGAAHTVASIRHFINYGFELAFLFEIKDGPNPSWGILSYEGKEKPRYRALKLLNLLEGERLEVRGEGTFVSALASASPQKITLILTNYDNEGRNTELVPVTFTNLENGIYRLNIFSLDESSITLSNIPITNSTLRRHILMKPNTVRTLELEKTVGGGDVRN